PSIPSMESGTDYSGPHARRRGRSLQELEMALTRRDPFWAPQVIVALAILLDLSLPEKLTVGPTWLLPAVEGLLLVGLILASPHAGMRHSPIRRSVGIALIGLVSAVNIASLVLLCHYLLHGGRAGGRSLILSGIVLWVTNV